jgi:predicted transcriptional regulator
LQLAGFGMAWDRRQRKPEEKPEERRKESGESAIEDVHDEILCEISDGPPRGLSVRQIANRLDLAPLRAEHYLDELEDRGFLECGSDGYYALTRRGVAHLVKSGFVE